MRYWTSDNHFSHTNIIKYCNRPFPNVAAMNAEMIRRWNETVTNNDEVWIVGDLILGRIEESLPIISQLNGRLVLIPGNHDRPWPGNRKGVTKWVHRYLDAGIDDILAPQVTTTIADTPVLVCHFPYQGDSHQQNRYQQHRPTDRGQWLIHGHVHDRWQVQDRQINVGADVWGFRPIPDTAIANIIRAPQRRRVR